MLFPMKYANDTTMIDHVRTFILHDVLPYLCYQRKTTIQDSKIKRKGKKQLMNLIFVDYFCFQKMH
jgi:hypothetical protein